MLSESRERRLSRTVISLIVSLVVSIILWVNYSRYDKLITLLAAILITLYLFNDIIQIIQLLRTNAEEPEDVALAIAKKMVGVPRLDEPCLVTITRPSRLGGASNLWLVHLFDVEIGTLRNGETLKFLTVYPKNELKIYIPPAKVIEENIQATAGDTNEYFINALGQLEEV